MRTKIELMGLCILLLTMGATAQQAVTTSGSPTANTIPLFTGSSSVGNSLISQSPDGGVSISGIPIANVTSIPTPSNGTYVIAYGGRIKGEYILSAEGPNRVQTVHLLLNANQFDTRSSLQILENHSYNLDSIMSNFRLLISADNATVYLVMDVNHNNISAINVQFQGAAQYGATFGGTLSGTETPMGYLGLAIGESGQIGIGTVSPGASLEVKGNVKLTSGSGASMIFADGTTQSTAWTGTLCGGDYAESVDVSGDRTKYEPGDVLVVDPDAPGHFLKADEKYSTTVAGIYSTKPGLVGRRQAAATNASTSEVPMAMVGIVPTKVSAENGAIKPGDILVASATLGHAMKGTDRSLLAGAIVGKALGSLKSGTGVIEVLVSLQ